MGKREKKYSVDISIACPGLTYHIKLMVQADGSAEASIQGNWGFRLYYYGKIVPLDQSNIYR